MEATVRKLVSFGTRHTLSDTKAIRGIGAAQRWVKSEFDNYAMASGGRLTCDFTIKADGKQCHRQPIRKRNGNFKRN
jgi:hypothetical protein